MPGPTLRIVQVNDVYSLENLPRLATLVRHHAETGPADAFVVVMAGDFLAPSILSSLDAGRGMVDCLNAVGITHVGLGNHEDDVPVARLHERLRELAATCIATNLHGFDPPLSTHDVVEVAAPGGRRVRVGLVGVVMDDAAVYRGAPFGGAQLEPPNPAALREAAGLVREGGCACVVPITHQPIDDDRVLAREGAEARLPVLLGGHEHVTFLEQVACGTWIVKAGVDAVKAAVIDLAWPAEAPAEGHADMPEVTLHLEATADYPEDAALRRLVDEHMTKVHALEGATLMALAPGETLSSVGGRSRPTSVATLVCSRLRDALGADVCLFNGGGIRASRDYRERFTYGDLEAEVPFDNEMVVVRMPGRVVRDAVAASRAHAPAESGAYLQTDDGVVVEPDHRVTAIAGSPLNADRDYRVAIVRNLLAGMDHIEPLVRFGHEHPGRVPPDGSGRDVKIVLVAAFARALWQRLGGFDEVDANHDGQVTPSEIESAVARFTHTQPSPLAAGLVLNAIDVKHQGAITRDEVEGLEKGRGEKR